MANESEEIPNSPFFIMIGLPNEESCLYKKFRAKLLNSQDTLNKIKPPIEIQIEATIPFSLDEIETIKESFFALCYEATTGLPSMGAITEWRYAAGKKPVFRGTIMPTTSGRHVVYVGHLNSLIGERPFHVSFLSPSRRPIQICKNWQTCKICKICKICKFYKICKIFEMNVIESCRLLALYLL